MGIPETLTALSDPARRRILNALRTQVMDAGTLAEAVDLQPSRLSYHLRKLREAELVTVTRQGNHLYYTLNLSILDETIVWLSDLRRQSAIARASRYTPAAPVRDARETDGLTPPEMPGD